MVSPANEVAERGKVIYQSQIQPRITESDAGKFLVIDVATGAYDIDGDEMSALRRAKERRKDPVLFVMRIGFKTAHKMGGHLVAPVSST